MITFPSAITINVAQPVVAIRPPISISQLDYSVTYDNNAKTAVARIKQIGRNIILWSGQDYVDQGQFTDAMVDAQVTSLLGDNPKAVIEALLKGVQPYVEPVVVVAPENPFGEAPVAEEPSAPVVEDAPVEAPAASE
jgi:hypothetical protein